MKYRITIDGKTYEMEVERMDGAAAAPSSTKPAASVVPVAAPAPAAPVKTSAPAATVSSTQNSPMPGTILRVLAAVGDQVTKGQPILVLEAMKMENEITSPKDGKLTALFAAAGDAVPGGAPLFSVGD